MREERLKVLEMLAAGKFNAEEADALLEALQGGAAEGAGSSGADQGNPFFQFDFGSLFEKTFAKTFGDKFGKGSAGQR